MRRLQEYFKIHLFIEIYHSYRIVHEIICTQLVNFHKVNISNYAASCGCNSLLLIGILYLIVYVIIYLSILV